MWKPSATNTTGALPTPPKPEPKRVTTGSVREKTAKTGLAVPNNSLLKVSAMKKFTVILVALAAALPVFSAPKPNAEAKKLLQKFAEKGKKFRPASGRTAFFARGQLKYGLERNDYLHRWSTVRSFRTVLCAPAIPVHSSTTKRAKPCTM
jgi:hypothetical protein